MITNEQLAHWRKLADDTPPDWTAPLKDLGAIPSFQAVDFYFDNSYEVYPPLGYCGPLLVAASKEVAEFATAARTAVPALLDELASERKRAEAAEADNRRLRATLEQIAHNEYTDNQIDETIHAALAASAPETKQGEREQLAEALLQWAENKWGDFEDYFCKFCNADITVDYEIGEDGKMFNMSKEIIICDHAPDCLHLRAKALRAQAGGEG